MSKSIIIFGFHAIQTQLGANPERIIQVWALNNRNDKRLTHLTDQLSRFSIHTQKSSKQHIDKLTKTVSHQGICAEIRLPPLPNQDALMDYLSKLKTIKLILILDSVQDPRNLGACLRSANGAGVDCIIINKDGSAPINSLAHKTAAGALGRLKIFQVTNLSRTIKALKKQNIWIVGLDSNTEQSLYKTDLTTPTALVIGGENSGLRVLTKQSCDQLSMIPMQGNVESLNLSVATGIALFEAKRQRQI